MGKVIGHFEVSDLTSLCSEWVVRIYNTQGSQIKETPYGLGYRTIHDLHNGTLDPKVAWTSLIETRDKSYERANRVHRIEKELKLLHTKFTLIGFKGLPIKETRVDECCYYECYPFFLYNDDAIKYIKKRMIDEKVNISTYHTCTTY